MFKKGFTFSVLILLLDLVLVMDSASLRFASYDASDSDWDKLFGHLSLSDSILPVESDIENVEVESENLLDSEKSVTATAQPTELPSISKNKPVLPKIPPMPPAAPFIFNPDSKDNKFPSVGANTQGNMEGIAISQDRGIALGIYMVHSSYNKFNTVFGTPNITKK